MSQRAVVRAGGVAGVVLVLGLLGAGCGPSSKHVSAAPVGPGTSAFTLLAGGAPAIRVEVDYVAGRTPAPEALALLRQRLVERCRVDDVEIVLDDELPRTGRELWTLGDAAALEAERRDLRPSDALATIYVAYVDGRLDLEAGRGSLGWTFGPTAILLFPDELTAAREAGLTRGDAEGAVLVHELGHVLGLVDLLTPARTEHRDLWHHGHCSEASCVMSWRPTARVTEFGPLCREDLRAAGGR